MTMLCGMFVSTRRSRSERPGHQGRAGAHGFADLDEALGHDAAIGGANLGVADPLTRSGEARLRGRQTRGGGIAIGGRLIELSLGHDSSLKQIRDSLITRRGLDIACLRFGERGLRAFKTGALFSSFEPYDHGTGRNDIVDVVQNLRNAAARLRRDGRLIDCLDGTIDGCARAACAPTESRCSRAAGPPDLAGGAVLLPHPATMQKKPGQGDQQTCRSGWPHGWRSAFRRRRGRAERPGASTRSRAGKSL